MAGLTRPRSAMPFSSFTVGIRQPLVAPHRPAVLTPCTYFSVWQRPSVAQVAVSVVAAGVPLLPSELPVLNHV